MITISRVALVLLACFSLTSLSAAETVTLQLTDGRSMTAELESRVDANHVWLRYGGGTTIVLRPVAWKQVAAAEHRGLQISVRQLQHLVRHAQPAPGKRVSISKPASISQAQLARQLLGFVPPASL